ncbi:glycosyltransferase family A protein [Arthrobacter sp.]|uniref:glycosyltransferase family 2 protein n=1 Tax=Arthrobacter sp. TaxID=1667 RepID=UPI0026DF79FB|nr:glycosyltransferase family A protein [Arthrobacter sp.]MDO5751472.1 glycosyltransferase family A protein [Arthrobacter sp.]
MNQSIEVIIPVHDPARPLARGLRSVLGQRAELAALGVDLVVTVVCHNLAVAAFTDSLPSYLVADDAVAWLPCLDGSNSPAGPRNTALAASSATFLCFLDSDDYLEPGALAAWWRAAQEPQAAAVIAPLRTPEGSILRTPRIRPSKPAVLDPVRDGLAYRSLPFGLLRRQALLGCGFGYAEGIPVGEDLEATLKLWFRGGRIVYPYGAPAYQQTDDSGPERVTSTLRPLAEEFQWLDAMVQAPWLREATLRERRSIAVKLMRIHGIGSLLRRGQLTGPEAEAAWSEAEKKAWQNISRHLTDMAGGELAALSRKDAQLSREAAKANNAQQLRAAVVRHGQAGRMDELVTEQPLVLLSHDSVLRHYFYEQLRQQRRVFSLR